MAATWSMGPGTLEVPMSLFAKNRQRLAEQLQSGQVVVLQGGESISHYDTDVEYVFRQEAYFTWICGVREEGCLFALDVGSSKSYLFVPRLPAEYEVWMGKLHSCEDFKRIYAVDEVHYVDELPKVIKGLNPKVLLTMSGQNSDSGLLVKEAVFEGIDEFMVDNEILFPIIAELLVPLSPKSSSDDGIHEELRELLKNSRETYSDFSIFGNKPSICIQKVAFGEMELVQKTTDGHPKTGDGKIWQSTELKRVIKTPEEIEVMRYVTKVSSDAHKQVMLFAKPGLMEYQCESVFLDHCYRVGGCRHVSYTCICGTGHNAATLHYGHAGAPNSKLMKPGDMCLFDMGGNYAGYAADITCSFPADGKFTADQKLVYEAVLFARDAVIEAARPGVMWPDMHLVANRVMLEHLKKGGLLKGDVEDMIKAGVNGILQPHGLGHLLGLDVHDVGGYLPECPTRPSGPLSRLRTARRLLPGMLLTIEPGCYFIPPLLNGAKNNPEQSKFFNWDVVDRFAGFGGVRIEDDVLITETGVENLTFVPRTVAEIEDFMANGANFK